MNPTTTKEQHKEREIDRKLKDAQIDIDTLSRQKELPLLSYVTPTEVTGRNGNYSTTSSRQKQNNGTTSFNLKDNPKKYDHCSLFKGIRTDIRTRMPLYWFVSVLGLPIG